MYVMRDGKTRLFSLREREREREREERRTASDRIENGERGPGLLLQE